MELIGELRDGLSVDDRRGGRVVYRFLRATDDVAHITELLHLSYAPLAAEGLRFLASHQSPETTSRRMAQGDTVVAEMAGRIIGVITLATSAATEGSPFYDRSDVARFGQFAVERGCQRAGVGSTLLTLVEQLARARGVKVLGLDTSEQASELMRFYASRGYEFIEFVRWPDVNYRSVVMAKQLEPSEPSRESA